MKIIADENIIFIRQAFSQFGEVKTLPGRSITNKALKDADILLVRSVTNVDEYLLNNTAVKFVGTATIGTDHIDKNYLKEKEIFFSDAAGSNSDAVAEYVITAIMEMINNSGEDLSGKTIGIIGHGNIGSRIDKFAQAIGLNVLINDPPMQKKLNKKVYVSLDAALGADIITFHVPLIKEGKNKTVHLINEKNIHCIKDNAVLINSSRGVVIDNEALDKALEHRHIRSVLDVWENEPHIRKSLLKKVEIATPHIAGYSEEGKINGTKMLYESLCSFSGTKPSWESNDGNNSTETIDLKNGKNIEEILYKITRSIYSIKRDDIEMKKMISMNDKEAAEFFDALRKNYSLRREFPNYSIKLGDHNIEIVNLLKALRLKI